MFFNLVLLILLLLDCEIMEENVKRFKIIFWPVHEYQHIPPDFDVKTREIVEVFI